MGEVLEKYNIMLEDEVKRYFEIWSESVIRSRMTITAVFLKIANVELNTEVEPKMINDQISNFLKVQIRKKDLLFKVADEQHWGILFLQSSDVEAKTFLHRIFSMLEHTEVINGIKKLSLKAAITEIRNNSVTFETLLEKNKKKLSDDRQPAWLIEQINDYRERPIEQVKVSIIEQNDIFRKVLETTIGHMNIPNINLEISAYEDGYSFLQSDNYKSGHLHLVLMNDILPLKNGLEILYKLRKMPNEKKFIIYMMSERNSESAIMNAYESGVDEFLVKPFNLRLLEAKIKRTFARLWV